MDTPRLPTLLRCLITLLRCLIILPRCLIPLIALTHAHLASANASQCLDRGGTPVQQNCVCAPGRTYIDPAKTSCPVTGASPLLSLNPHTSPDPACSTPGTLSEKPGSPPLPPVLLSALCDDPARYLCDPARNPTLEKMRQLQAQIQSEQAAARQSPMIQQFIRDHSGGTAQNCSELPLADYEQCLKLEAPLLKVALATTQRQGAAKKIFIRAKEALIATLRAVPLMHSKLNSQKNPASFSKWPTRSETPHSLLIHRMVRNNIASIPRRPLG